MYAANEIQFLLETLSCCDGKYTLHVATLRFAAAGVIGRVHVRRKLR
jgi:hypothetical protein